jgi:hypothetical protein
MHDETVRVGDALAVASRALPQAARLESPTAAADCRTDRCGAAIEQAAQLAGWEDEGGSTSS